ncbi:MAG: hypothetical protein Q9191_006920, partial [Dirinaria sp. TL-2023a]
DKVSKEQLPEDSTKSTPTPSNRRTLASSAPTKSVSKDTIATPKTSVGQGRGTQETNGRQDRADPSSTIPQMTGGLGEGDQGQEIADTPMDTAKQPYKPWLTLDEPICIKCLKRIPDLPTPCDVSGKRCSLCSSLNKPCEKVPVEFFDKANVLLAGMRKLGYFEETEELPKFTKRGEYEELKELSLLTNKELTLFMISESKKGHKVKAPKSQPKTTLDIGLLLLEEIRRVANAVEGVATISRINSLLTEDDLKRPDYPLTPTKLSLRASIKRAAIKAKLDRQRAADGNRGDGEDGSDDIDEDSQDDDNGIGDEGANGTSDVNRGDEEKEDEDEEEIPPRKRTKVPVKKVKVRSPTIDISSESTKSTSPYYSGEN